MTAQNSDRCHYRGKLRTLAGIHGAGLFEPGQHGIRPFPFSSACWGGFHCSYAIADGALVLTQVNLGLDKEDGASAERGEGPRLFDKLPQRRVEFGRWVHPRTGAVTTRVETMEFRVEGLREPMPFTGGLLLGDDFLWELYIHMGYHPGYTFREVHELIFDVGRLVEEHDRSDRMAELRERIGSEREAPPSRATRREIEEWVKRCFSLEY